MKTILNEQQISLTLKRLAHQVLENHIDFTDTVIIGLQPRGIYVSDKIVEVLRTNLKGKALNYGILDITF